MDAAAQEKDAVAQEKDATSQEKDATSQEKDAAAQEKDANAQVMGVVAQENNAVALKKDAVAQENNAAALENDAEPTEGKDIPTSQKIFKSVSQSTFMDMEPTQIQQLKDAVEKAKKITKTDSANISTRPTTKQVTSEYLTKIWTIPPGKKSSVSRKWVQSF